MEIYPLDLVMVVWLFAGTFVIKKLQLFVAKGKLGKWVFLFIAILLGALSLIVLKFEIAEYSAISVVFGGMAFFWFAILSSRETESI